MTKAGERLAIGLALLATLAMVLPFLYMLATALTGEWEAFRYPPALIPARAHLENFPAALTVLPFDRFFLNSAILATCVVRSEEHTSELQSRPHLVCRLLLEKKKKKIK